MDINLIEIAYVDSCYKDRFAVPRQSLLVRKAEARIVFHPWVQPEIALDGIMEFSHLWVIFGFHLNKAGRYHAKVHPPRLNGGAMGVFATRSPHRPNPLGLSLVEIVKVSSNHIEVLGGDFANHTPVYDIKPYLPETEVQVNAIGGWSSNAESKLLVVDFENPEVKNQFELWSEEIAKPSLQDIVFETLCHDPRPLVYRNANKDYKDTHVLTIFDGKIHFYVLNNKAIIFKIIHQVLHISSSLA